MYPITAPRSPNQLIAYCTSHSQKHQIQVEQNPVFQKETKKITTPFDIVLRQKNSPTHCVRLFLVHQKETAAIVAVSFVV